MEPIPEAWWAVFGVVLPISCFFAQYGGGQKSIADLAIVGWLVSIGIYVAGFIVLGWTGVLVLAYGIAFSWVADKVVGGEDRPHLEKMDLRILRERFRGKRYAELVEYHLKQQNQDDRIRAIESTTAMLRPSVRRLVMRFIDQQNARALDRDFWQKDCASVLDEVTADAKRLVETTGEHVDDETLFNLFNIITMNYAYSAWSQPKMREFMGI